MKILHTADWHIGTFKGPEKDGVNLRALDTQGCLEAMVEKAREERPELVLVSGDIFHLGKTWSDRCCNEVVLAMRIISELAEVSEDVIVMRGTPNHDGEGPFKVLKAHFAAYGNVWVVTEPEVINTVYADVAVLPGFDAGVFRAQFPGLGKDVENEAISKELGNIVMGMRLQCQSGKPAILMAHYTVPGCNMESGQSQMLTQFEPVVPLESLESADYDLVALGHIHRPQALKNIRNAFYSGSINANNFNDEGQERGFWFHKFDFDLFRKSFTYNASEFCKTPYREFLTYHFKDTDVTAIIQGKIEEVAMNYWRWNGAIHGKIVRVLYECSAEKKKAFNTSLLEKEMYADGAFWVAGVTPERITESANRENLSEDTAPEENLRTYLEEKGFADADAERLILKARPIIMEAMADDASGVFFGLFSPIEIEVENYRTYAAEKFNFEDIQFCTINGANGVGKSSLFMDAIMDCLFEQPREGYLFGENKRPIWLRNDESVRSGYIAFTFSLGQHVYRVVRGRQKSGKITLNLSEMVDGTWENRSGKNTNDTQNEIEKILGIDSMTFKSCALIMQDQYGLFLQAKKEERMAVLGNLLGLGIYTEMERLSKEIFSDKKRLSDGKKNNMELLGKNILAAGRPLEELEEINRSITVVEGQLKEKNLELQSNMILLTTKKEAQERRNKLLEGISILEQKKAATGQNRESERQVIADCDVLISQETEISQKAERYHLLEQRAGELSRGATLYTQTSELDRINQDIVVAESELQLNQKKREESDGQLRQLESRTDAEHIREKAALYSSKKSELDSMYLKRQEYDAAVRRKESATYAYDSKKTFFDEQERTLNTEESSLRKRTELLLDSGCIDIENAGCRFLADAIQAKKELEVMPERRAKLEEEKEMMLSGLKKKLDVEQEAVKAVEYRQEAMEALQAECTTLKRYEEELAKLQADEQHIALLKASIENIQSNIAKAEERLCKLKREAERLTEEREKYKEDYISYHQAMNEMETLKSWLEKERELPVVRERRANAIRRIADLEQQLTELEAEIADKQEQADAEAGATAGMDELVVKKDDLSGAVKLLTDRIKELQVKTGRLEEKAAEIKKMQANIQVLQKEVNELSVDVADYENLRMAFSQDGIPHQIVRTILPKLSDTANSILGQMTGGQLGVDFRTEKILNSSKKEKVALDIFIEEYGKTSLPYLSKSGGEKVKASLSVILALAEIKSSTAGIQFGMLFIDEPPFLDSEGIQAYCDALETIRLRYPGIKIMAITHDPTMKARFPQNLDIIKTENGSKVIY